MNGRPTAIDCWLNPTTGMAGERPEFLVRVARDYFKREREMFAHTPTEELLAQMDAAGVERAIITMDRPCPRADGGAGAEFPRPLHLLGRHRPDHRDGGVAPGRAPGDQLRPPAGAGRPLPDQ